jgi:hypothetical protein
MTRDAIRILSDAELEQVAVWARDEAHDRAVKRKQETIAKIRDLAASAGVHVKINGARGRPARDLSKGGQGPIAPKPGTELQPEKAARK